MSAITGSGPRPGAAPPSAPLPAVDLPDPAVTDFDRTHDLPRGRADGPLFVGGANADDPLQGWVGDCYLVASMSALAQARPDLVKGLFTENADGTVTVKLHEPGPKDEKGKPGPTVVREVRVDRDIVLERDAKTGALKPRYGASTQSDAAGAREAWVPLLEKAWAERAGGFAAIEGGNAGAALETLTGAKCASEIVGDHLTPADMAMAEGIARFLKVEPDKTGLAASLSEQRKNGTERTWKFLSEAASRGDPIVAQTYPDPAVVGRGFLPMHAYTVAGVSERDGKRFVTLRNPAPYQEELEHPTDEMKAAVAARDDFRVLGEILQQQRMGLSELKYGTFEVPLEEFRASFDSAFSVPVGEKK